MVNPGPSQTGGSFEERKNPQEIPVRERPLATDPGAMDSLRELAQATMEQDDAGDSVRNLAISALAMVGLAAIVGIVGWWLMKGGLSEGAGAMTATQRSGPHHTVQPTGQAQVLSGLFMAGAGAMLVAAILLLFALISLSKITMRKLSP